MNNGDVRTKCLYRALRVGWIREIIELYNENDVRVKYWEKVNSKKKNRFVFTLSGRRIRLSDCV